MWNEEYNSICNSLKKQKTKQNKTKQKTKNLGINLTKEAKDLYNENYKTLKKEIKTLEDGKISHVLG